MQKEEKQQVATNPSKKKHQMSSEEIEETSPLKETLQQLRKIGWRLLDL